VSEVAFEQEIGRLLEFPFDLDVFFDDLLALRTLPPEIRSKGYRVAAPKFEPGRRRDYLERESRNRALGLAGEKLILQYEHQRLWRAGQRRLADRIEHVSVSKGDHLGYDIHSFDTSGKNLMIEVKTTRFGPWTPFYATSNEVEVSRANADHYELYRVYSFEKSPRLFGLPGALHRSLHLEPSQYVAQLMPASDE